MLFFIIISAISVHPVVQDYNPRAGLAQSAMVAVYCTYLTMSAVSMEPDDKKCNPLLRARGTRTASIVLGAFVTFLTIAYTTTRAATQTIGLGNKTAGYTAIPGDEHNLVTQQPTERAQMRAETIRRLVDEGTLPSGYIDSDDDEDDGPGDNDDERGSTMYNYTMFHIIFLLATAWTATLITMNVTEGKDGDFVPVGRTYAASWVKVVSAWVCYAIYGWTLVAPVVLPDRFDY